MSRTVPKADSWSRLNALEKRIATLERVVFPPQFAYLATNVSTVSSSYAAEPGSPSLTVKLGPSGDAIVLIAAAIQLSSATLDEAFVGLSIDGGAALQALTFTSAAATTGASTTFAARLSDLNGAPLAPPGLHTFTLEQRGQTNGNLYSFAQQALMIWPL